MVSAPAFILGLLVIVVGMLIIPDILQGQQTVVEERESLACTLHQGTCVSDGECAPANELDHDCGEGKTCCTTS